MLRFDEVAVAASADSSTLRVKHPSYFVRFDLLLNTRTGETVRVDEARPMTMSVTRGIGSTPCPMREGDEILKVGSCEPETLR